MDKQSCAAVIKHYRRVYFRATKKGKREILEVLIGLTGYHRKYLIRRLGDPGQPAKYLRRHKPSPYAPVLEKLKELWTYGKYPCSRRFKVMIPIYLDALVRFGEITLTDEEKRLIGRISERTIDRHLKAERRQLTLKARSGTKPGTLLKSQIPVKMWTDWDQAKPGFLEIDSVHHNGGNPSGFYGYTVSLEDVATGWHENQAHLGKSEAYTLEAIDLAGQRFPFPVLGLDFDTGGEFVNWHLKQYCDRKRITYTRARQGVKNDQCYVEQSNWSQVREYVGYSRYDQAEQVKRLNQIYRVMSDYLNYFQAKERCVKKTRNGAKVKRVFETRTPYQQILAQPDIPQAVKNRLTKHYLTLNPKQLLKNIVGLQQLLSRLGNKICGATNGR